MSSNLTKIIQNQKKILLKLKKPKDIETEPKKSTLRYLFFTCKEIHK